MGTGFDRCVDRNVIPFGFQYVQTGKNSDDDIVDRCSNTAHDTLGNHYREEQEG